MNNEYEIMNVKDLQNALNVGLDKARHIMKLKDLGAIKVGNSYMVTRKNFHKWLEKNSGKDVTLTTKEFFR